MRLFEFAMTTMAVAKGPSPISPRGSRAMPLTYIVKTAVQKSSYTASAQEEWVASRQSKRVHR
jgi:hypothetical protein